MWEGGAPQVNECGTTYRAFAEGGCKLRSPDTYKTISDLDP